MRKITNLLFALIAILSLSFDINAASYDQPSGNGTEESPYLIATASNLRWFSAHVLTGSEEVRKSHARLTADIDLGGGKENEFTPIGDKESHPFMGVFVGG